MNTELRTFDSVVNDINTAISTRQVLTPELWMEAALILNVLVESQEEPKLFELEKQVAELQIALKENKPELTEKGIERITKISPLWMSLMKQKGRIKMANELVRLSKKHASLASELMRNQL